MTNNMTADHALAGLWNTFVPTGSQVYVAEDDNSEVETKTRSTAWVCHSGDAVIMLEDRAGSHLLSRVRVMTKHLANTIRDLSVASEIFYDPYKDQNCPPCDCADWGMMGCSPSCSRTKYIREKQNELRIQALEKISRKGKDV